MAKRRPQDDPFAARESQRYDKPIASREHILELLREMAVPVDREQLSSALHLTDDEQLDALRRRLRAMERDGQLMCDRRGRYALVEKLNLIRGKVQAHRDGYGFVVVDSGEDIYLNGRQMSTVFHGDEVLVRVSGTDRRGRLEGTIVEVIGRNTTQVVGRLNRESGSWFVVPDNPRITQDILIPAEQVRGESGQYVVAEITQQPGWHTPVAGRVLEVLGDHMAPGMETEVAIRAHDIPHVWPHEVEGEAKQLSPEPREAHKQHRVDIRHLPLVTIDGEDAKDFDDAVYCEAKKGGGWRLWVAIADVSHYVQLGSALDVEARTRGTSVYFPDRVVPMLPEVLSNGLCSLKPEVDRLCLVCEMTISAKGRLSSFEFYEAVMHSHARLTYNKVWAMLRSDEQVDEKLRERYRDLLPQLRQLHALYAVLRAARTERGAIDFETTETRIVFGPERKIDDIIPVERNDAHKIIEECMLCANVAAARFLEKHELPALYRVHQGPGGDKLVNLRQFLGELRLDLGGGAKPTPRDYQALLSQVQARPDAHIIQTMMLRSLSQAVYQPENLGHFGLHYTAYAHFTSPIRRYPDLLVHRALRHVIRGRQTSDQVRRVKGAKVLSKAAIYPYTLVDMVTLGEHCSMTERRADEATRAVVAWLKCEYLKDRVGEVFDGVVSGVTGFGLFVELRALYVEGLVHVSSLDRDYYHFDTARQRLQGERTGTSYHLGDAVTVRLVRVDLDDKKIDLEVVTASTRGRRRQQREGAPVAEKPQRDKPSKKNGGTGTSRGARKRQRR